MQKIFMKFASVSILNSRKLRRKTSSVLCRERTMSLHLQSAVQERHLVENVELS